MNKKLILTILGLIVFFFGIPLGVFLIKQQVNFRLSAQNSTNPENVLVSAIAEQTATISWTTNQATRGFINYGIFPGNLTLVQSENTASTNHQVNLVGLMPQTKYYFQIKIEDKIFDNQGQPFSFTTLAKVIQPLSEAGFQSAMGTPSLIFDLNHDGIVNSLDLAIFRQQAK